MSVIGGYLGSGKTTLINRLLRGADGMRIAVMVNDFGSINIDAELISAHDGDTISLTNGCICCSMGSGLTAAMTELAEVPDRFDHVVIEVSGVGDPWKVAQWGRAPGFVLDGVVVLAAADQVKTQGADRYIGETIQRQLEGADLVVVTRADLVAEAQLADTVAWVGSHSRAQPTVAKTSDVPLSYVVGAGSVDDTIDHGAAVVAGGSAPHAVHGSWTVPVDPTTNRADVQRWLDAAPAGVVRVKGLVRCIDEPTALMVQKVGHRVEIDRWREAELAGSLVVIASPGTELLPVETWMAAAPSGPNAG